MLLFGDAVFQQWTFNPVLIGPPPGPVDLVSRGAQEFLDFGGWNHQAPETFEDL